MYNPQKYGISEITISVVKKLHANVTYLMKVGREMTEIEGTVGVKQGDNLGPILFIILVNAVAESLNKNRHFRHQTYDGMDSRTKEQNRNSEKGQVTKRKGNRSQSSTRFMSTMQLSY